MVPAVLVVPVVCGVSAASWPSGTCGSDGWHVSVETSPCIRDCTKQCTSAVMANFTTAVFPSPSTPTHFAFCKIKSNVH